MEIEGDWARCGVFVDALLHPSFRSFWGIVALPIHGVACSLLVDRCLSIGGGMEVMRVDMEGRWRGVGEGREGIDRAYFGFALKVVASWMREEGPTGMLHTPSSPS